MREKKYILLEAQMMSKGVTNRALADALGIAESTLFKKRIGKTDFTVDEIRGIGNTLELTPEQINEIFLI